MKHIPACALTPSNRQAPPPSPLDRPAKPVYSRGRGLPPPCRLAPALRACPRPAGLPPPCGGAEHPLLNRFRARLWGLLLLHCLLHISRRQCPLDQRRQNFIRQRLYLVEALDPRDIL